MTSHPSAPRWKFFCGIANGADEGTTMKGSETSVFRSSTLTFAIFIATLKEIIYRAVLHASILYYHRKLIAEAEPRKCCFYKSNTDQHDGRAVVCGSFPTLETSLEILSTSWFRWCRSSPALRASPWTLLLAPWRRKRRRS